MKKEFFKYIKIETKEITHHCTSSVILLVFYLREQFAYAESYV